MNKEKKIHLVVIFIVSFLMYSNTLKNSFVWDDKGLIENLTTPEYKKHLSNPLFFLTPSYWKDYTKFHDVDAYVPVSPIRMLSLNIDYKIWGYKPFGFHLTNVIIHIINTILVYFFVILIFKSPVIAFYSSLLFALHPMHSESVNWIKNRIDIIATAFLLISLITFIKFITEEFKNKKIYIISIISYFFALLSKEISITFVLIIAVYALYFIEKKLWKKVFIYFTPHIILTGFYFIMTQVVLKKGLNIPYTHRLDIYTNILLVFKTIANYLVLVIFPFSFNADRDIELPKFLFEKETFLSVTIVLIVFYIGYILYKRNRDLSFMLLWFIITILPVSNIIYLAPRPVAEQRLYLPSIGFCAFFGVLFYYIKNMKIKTEIIKLLFVFVCIIYFAFGFKRNFVWRDDMSLWSHTVKVSPDNARVWVNLGQAYFLNGELENARKAFEKALKIAPGFPDANKGLAFCYLKMNNGQKVIEHLRLAGEIN